VSRKAANGRGNKIRENPKGSGKFPWRITTGVGPNGEQLRTGGVGDSHAAASAARDEALVAARRGTLIRSANITIWDYSQEWLQSRVGQITASTWDQYRMALEHIPAPIRRVKVQSLTDKHLAQIDQTMVVRVNAKGEKLSPAAVTTRRKVFTVIGMVLKAAARERLIPAGTVPHHTVRMTSRDRARPGERPALNPAETKALIDTCRDHDQRIIPWLLFSLGLRRGEMLGLRWSDIDWQAPSIRLEQQVRVAGSIVEISDELKTSHAYRTLGLAPDLIAVLKEHRAKQARWRTGPAWNPNNLIVVTTAGTGYRPRSVNQLLDRLSARAGIRHIASHAGRRTSITAQIRAGKDLEVVAARAGHGNSDLTRNVYRRVMDDELRSDPFILSDFLPPDSEGGEPESET
jgi:integrase